MSKRIVLVGPNRISSNGEYHLVRAIAYDGDLNIRDITARSYEAWPPDKLATLRAELVETITRLAGWTDADDVEVIG